MGSRQVDTDVVVVGAGPAGSAAAIACAERGLGVVLCERDRFDGERPGETLHPGIEPLLAQLGLGDRLAQVVGARHEGIWIEWGGPRRFEPFGSDEQGPWSGFQVRRSAFDSLMIARARELGVDVRQPLGVTAALVEQGEIRGVVTEAGPIAARMVIDASGASRWLSRKLPLRHTRHSPRLIARFGYAEGSCPERDGAPSLVGDASGWTWTAKVWRSTYQWTRVAFGRPPERGWIPQELARLAPRGRIARRGRHVAPGGQSVRAGLVHCGGRCRVARSYVFARRVEGSHIGNDGRPPRIGRADEKRPGRGGSLGLSPVAGALVQDGRGSPLGLLPPPRRIRIRVSRRSGFDQMARKATSQAKPNSASAPMPKAYCATGPCGTRDPRTWSAAPKTTPTPNPAKCAPTSVRSPPMPR